jgi:hypothetical protein
VTRPIRLALFSLLLAGALVAAATPSLLPAPAASTPPPHWRPDPLTVRGAYHVHSVASDGTGTMEQIAAAAARAGLHFVIVTDHGDGTRAPDPPRYVSGVLVIDATEVNTSGGHLVVPGARAAPFPLAGVPAAVLEDVHRLGGMGIAAHPGSPRAALRWTAWDTPLDGVEWLNADSEWRDEFLASLGRLMLTYSLRPAETLTASLDRPAAVLQQWDALTTTRRVVGLAGADAHARLGFGQQTEPYREGWHVPVPSYQSSFAAFSLRVPLDARMSSDPVRDAADILDRIRRGRVYTVVDGAATPGDFEFTATSGGHSARIGDYLDLAGEVKLHVKMAAPANARMVILRNGEILFETRDRETHVGVLAEPAVYRVEIYVPGGEGQPPMPWLVSNPIYVGMSARHEASATPAAAPATMRRSSIATDAWAAEASPGSVSTLRPNVAIDGVAAIEWGYQLAGGTPAGQYAAVRFPAEGLNGHDRVQLRARARQPVRVWVQVRASRLGEGERWGATVYLDDTWRGVELMFRDLRPIGITSSPTPPPDQIDVILLVVDTVNTRPGSTGAVQLAELWLAAQ